MFRLTLEQEDRAVRLHYGSIIIDGHCDTLSELIAGKRTLGEAGSHGHLDLPRLVKGGGKVQFFAAFIEKEYKPERSLKRTLQLIDHFFREIKANKELVVHAKTTKDIENAIMDSKVAAILSIEGGEALDGELGILRLYHRLGVRSITLTWNQRNQIADGVEERFSRGGLTRFGLEVVQEMNALGMLIDVSHLSEAGFWDVLESSPYPVAATHSNCFSICPHPRNLNDEQIRALDKNGGIMGLNFYPAFIGGVNPSVEDLLDHADHVRRLVGTQVLGLGSDFDGIDLTPCGLEDVTRLPNLTRGLVDRGYSDEEIKGILGGNFFRVLKQVIG